MKFIEDIELSGNECSKNEFVPDMIGKFSGAIIVLGSGLRLFSDIKRAQCVLGDTPHHTFAANLSYLAWNGTLEHLGSLHQNKLPHFYELSEDLPVSRVGHKTYAHCPFVNQQEGSIVWPIRDNNGTTSLFIIKVALLLGYDKIICCGMDLEGKHRFYDNPNLSTNNNFSCGSISASWEEYAQKPSFKKKVRSVSGKTLEFFGEATKDWLNDYSNLDVACVTCNSRKHTKL